MNFFSTPNGSEQKCLNPLFQNQRPLFLLPSLFQRVSQLQCQDQQNGKRTYVDYHPSYSGLTSRIQPHKLLTALSVSRIFVEFSLKPVYPTGSAKFSNL